MKTNRCFYNGFITIIYNYNWILLIIIPKTLSYTIKRNIKRIYYQCLLTELAMKDSVIKKCHKLSFRNIGY